MSQLVPNDGSKKVKNIVAIIYLLVLGFLVGGSYYNQNKPTGFGSAPATASQP